VAKALTYAATTAAFPKKSPVAAHWTHASFRHDMVNGFAGDGEVNRGIRTIDLSDQNTQLPDPAGRNVSWDEVRAYGYDVDGPSLEYGSRSPSGNRTLR